MIDFDQNDRLIRETTHGNVRLIAYEDMVFWGGTVQGAWNIFVPLQLKAVSGNISARFEDDSDEEEDDVWDTIEETRNRRLEVRAAIMRRTRGRLSRQPLLCRVDRMIRRVLLRPLCWFRMHDLEWVSPGHWRCRRCRIHTFRWP